MKNLSMILKILAAIVAIAGIIYVVVIYGERIAEGVRRAVNFVRRKFFSKGEEDFEDFAGMEVALDDFDD